MDTMFLQRRAKSRVRSATRSLLPCPTRNNIRRDGPTILQPAKRANASSAVRGSGASRNMRNVQFAARTCTAPDCTFTVTIMTTPPSHRTRRRAVCNAIYFVNAMHITASVFINDNESELHADYDRWLEELVPFDSRTDPTSGDYLHNRTGEDNADAHHKRQIMGPTIDSWRGA